MIRIGQRGFRITDINEEMPQTLATMKIIQNSEKQRFFEILQNNFEHTHFWPI